MNTFKIWFNIILILIVLILISWNLTNFNKTKLSTKNKIQQNCQINNSITYIYNSMGKLTYKLITNKTQYFLNDKIGWIINPILISYNSKNMPTWEIRANKSKITNDNILYLYGNVQVNNLNKTLDIQQILTEKIIINLITQDISSDSKVVIIGVGLKSIGTKMHGNIRTYILELIKNVKTYYNISYINK